MTIFDGYFEKQMNVIYISSFKFRNIAQIILKTNEVVDKTTSLTEIIHTQVYYLQ